MLRETGPLHSKERLELYAKHSWILLLKQQMSITIYHLPTKENKFRFPLVPFTIYMYIYIYIYLYLSISIYI
jgi:hypothetical protein